MFVCESSNYLFYSAGKIASQSLLALPDCKAYAPPLNQINGLRKDAISCIERLSVKNKNLQVTAVIREPKSRFLSGLFEIVAKQIYFSGIVTQAQLGYSAEWLAKQIDVFYNHLFWQDALSRTLHLKPNVWDSSLELSSHHWQYHCGNWLEDVYVVEKFLHSIGKSVTIIDVADLSKYLEVKNLPSYHFNTKENMFHRLDDLGEPYKKIAETVNGTEIYNAFLKGYYTSQNVHLQAFESYLESECTVYQNLLSKIIRF